MENSLAKKITQRLKALEEIRSPREGIWDDIIKFILPSLESIHVWKKPNRGTRIDAERYDGTGISALQLFADGLFGYLISPSIAWLKLVMRNELMEIPEVRTWLQECEEHLYGVFNQSNFYNAMSDYFENAPAIGFSTMYSEEDTATGKMVFHVYHPGPIYIAEDKYGYVDTVFRKERMQARKAYKMFGDRVSEKLKECLKRNEFEEWDFVHAVFPNTERDSLKIDSLNKPSASVWLQVIGDPQESDGRIVRQSGYDAMPYHVWRYKGGVTPYGFGPGEEALSEVMGANLISKDLLGAADKSVNPAYNIPSYMEGKVDVTPNGMNYTTEPNWKIEPVNTGIDFPVGIEREERLEKAIRSHFKVEYFTLLATLNAEGGKARTATEIIELQGEKAAVLGRPINRLNNECMNPVIDRVFDIELKAGRLPPVPAILEGSGEAIKVDYMGPLAQAQKKMFQVQGIQQGLDNISMLSEIKPESLDVIDGDMTARKLLHISGFPQDCINDRGKVRSIRETKLQVQQQKEAQENMVPMAGAMEKIARADNLTDGQVTEMMGDENASAAQ